jgi:hypothetical protein
MPRSGFQTQQCPCGGNKRAIASVTLAASSLGIVPRQKSRASTLYVCPDCLKDPKPRSRRAMIEAVLSAAIECLEVSNAN